MISSNCGTRVLSKFTLIRASLTICEAKALEEQRDDAQILKTLQGIIVINYQRLNLVLNELGIPNVSDYC